MSNFEVVVNPLPFWEPLLQSLISSAEMTLALYLHNSIFPTRLNKPQSCQCVDLHVTRDSQTRSLKLLTRIYYSMDVHFMYIYEMSVQNLDILCIFHVICDNLQSKWKTITIVAVTPDRHWLPFQVYPDMSCTHITSIGSASDSVLGKR